ncbi:MAG: hypothetical protein NXI10_09095 [bacterium]|nr:hypothetical protein [bacterium]
MIKNVLIVLFLSIVGFAQADQLAYISKEKAEEAAAWLNKGKTVYLFCGCCSVEEPVKVKVLEAKAKHTGYEDYWEVEIRYETEDGTVKTETIDLAYIWKKGLFKAKTLGKKFNMSHDPCIYLNDWDNRKHAVKD